MWESTFGTIYVALGIECNAKTECEEKIRVAKETLKELDEFPILTWSSYYRMFFLVTRFAHKKEKVMKFSKRLKEGGWKVHWERREDGIKPNHIS